MKVLLTFDLELFFGRPTGSVENCMVKPTKHLLNLARKHQVGLSFFWDVGHYLALKRNQSSDKQCSHDVILVENLISEIVENGHDLQLHVHPHWERARRVNGHWEIDVEGCYRLHDFSEQEREKIFSKYVHTTRQFAKNKVNTFRAGGWCIQPFKEIKDLFDDYEIKIDSSVMPGAKLENGAYYYDFTSAPNVDSYPFLHDVCQALNGGRFYELPITTNYYSPGFFWNLYVKGRMNPKNHLPMGDGNFIDQPGVRNNRLIGGQHFHASTDGYFAGALKEIFNRKRMDQSKFMVTIGHPKSLTPYALKKLDQFLEKSVYEAEFLKYSEVNVFA